MSDFTLTRKISPSSAWSIYKDLEKWKYDQENPKKETTYTATGSCLHCLVLEPENYDRKFYTPDDLPINKRYNKPYGRDSDTFKSWHTDKFTQCGDRKLIMLEEKELAQDMANSLLADDRFFDLVNINDTKAEQYIEWVDSETKHPCHGYYDLLTQNNLIDLKTVSDVSYSGIRRTCHDNGYFIKMAAYVDGIYTLTGKQVTPYIVAIRSVKPHTVKIFEIERKDIDKGLQLFRKAITQYQHAAKSGIWRNQPITETIGFYQNYF